MPKPTPDEVRFVRNAAYEAGLLGADIPEIRACYHELSKRHSPQRAASSMMALISLLQDHNGSRPCGGLERGLNQLKAMNPLQRTQMFAQCPGSREAYEALHSLTDRGWDNSPSELERKADFVDRYVRF